MYEKIQPILLKESCSMLCNNFTVFIDTRRHVGHYGAVSRNTLTVSSSPLQDTHATKPVNRPFVFRNPTSQRSASIVQVGSDFGSCSQR